MVRDSYLVCEAYLKGQGGDETLDPRSSVALLSLAFLQRQRALDDELPNVVLLGEVEQFADF